MSRGNKPDGRGQETHRSGQRGGESKIGDGLQDDRKGQGSGQRRITGQQAGQGHRITERSGLEGTSEGHLAQPSCRSRVTYSRHIARNKGTGSSMETHRQRVTGRMEDRENKRKGTGRGAQMEKETLQRATGQRQRGRERKKKVATSKRPEGQGKARRKDRVREKTGEGHDARL